jgi:hypothetical protein
MVLSELTNKELKSILQQNNVKNYSKLNKKDLVKKVNKLLNSQNGGNNNKMKNKKYILKESIGGNGEVVEEQSGQSASRSNNDEQEEKNQIKKEANAPSNSNKECGPCSIL